MQQTEFHPLPATWDADRWDRMVKLADLWCQDDTIPAISILAGQGDQLTGPYFFGRQTLHPDSPPLRSDSIFLVASITKPIVATGALLLLERGQLGLGDPVIKFLPEFDSQGKRKITIRHLLTHTSGLPDMLPANQELRASHAPLSEFVQRTCKCSFSFPPGQGVQYQSMGFAILGEIIQRITNQSCADFLDQELFQPLGMSDTALGAPDAWYESNQESEAVINRVPEIRVPEVQQGTEWSWNGRYWQSLGAPWGGLLTTATDLGRFARMMLNQGRTPDGRQLLSPASIQAATRNQLDQMRDVPEADRRCRPWGLGWRLSWPAHTANFGDLLGSNTYGHWGATGTVMWIDPDHSRFVIILTTQPQEPDGTWLARLSNMIAASCS